MSDPVDLGAHYALARTRLVGLLDGAPEDTWSTPVPACPGWDVKAVLSHLVGIIEDAAAGRLSGPPDEAQTAAEVERHRADDPAELLARWGELSPLIEAVATEQQIWPAVLDVVSHEQDVRGALGRPGGRDAEIVALGARYLVEGRRLSRPLTIDMGADGLVRSRGEGAPLELRASAFEVLRLRLGRRSRAQVLALDWSEDPGSVVDELFTFGPAGRDIVE